MSLLQEKQPEIEAGVTALLINSVWLINKIGNHS